MVVLKPEIKPVDEFSIVLPLLQAIRKPISFLISAHKEHGDVALSRFFSKRMIFLRSPKHIEECFVLEAKGLLNRDFLYPAKQSIFGDGLLNSKPDTWEKQRRLLQPLFTKEAINEWKEIIIEEATLTRNSLQNSGIPEVNLSDTIKSLIHCIFVRVLLGRTLQQNEYCGNVLQAVETISQGLLPQIVSEITSKGKLMWLMPHQHRRYQAAVKLLKAFIGNEFDRKQAEIGNDLLSFMMQSSFSKTGYTMSRERVIDEAINLFVAGQDTTLTALLWFFYLIGKHTDVHKKVTKEIAKHKNEPLTAENFAQLSYTKAVLNEVLRLYPPVPGICTQAIEELTIDGCIINKGSIVIFNTYGTHHHPELWENPDEFYPEHFCNAETAANRHKYAFFPFGGGLHNCIGRHFAEMEMMMIIVTLLRTFRDIVKSGV